MLLSVTCHFFNIRHLNGLTHCNLILILTASQAQSGHRGLPTSPSITAALGDDIAHTTQEESLQGYEEWSLGRHSWMRNDHFGDDEASEDSGSYLLRDFSSYLGESPLFEAAGLSVTSVPRFSTLELVSYHLVHRSFLTYLLSSYIMSPFIPFTFDSNLHDMDTSKHSIFYIRCHFLHISCHFITFFRSNIPF